MHCLLILLCVLYVGYRIYETKSDAAALQAKTLEDAVPTVAVITPKPAAPTETITLPGNIQAWFQAPIYAQVSGYVKMWYKDYGALVKKGDVLAEINAPALDAQYAQAKADLESERAKYALADMTAKRWVALRTNHAVSEQSISVKEAEAKAEAAKVKASEQNVRNFEALIRFKTIVAPYDGVVTVRNINVGDYVNKEGTFSTPSCDQQSLYRGRRQYDAPLCHRAGVVRALPPPWPDGRRDGAAIARSSFHRQIPDRRPGFDVSTRTAITVFTIDNEDRALWPGSYAKVVLTAPVDRQSPHDSVHRAGVPGAWHASGRGDGGRPSALATNHRE